MPSTPTPCCTRPNSAPASYLDRPACFWIIVTTCHTGAACRRPLGHLDLDSQADHVNHLTRQTDTAADLLTVTDGHWLSQ